MIKIKKGTIHLFLISLLSSFLIAFMLMNEKTIKFYTALFAQRFKYVQHNKALQNISQSEKQQYCQNLTTSWTVQKHSTIINLSDQADSIQHYWECERITLFHKKLPTVKSQQTELTQFINMENLSIFQEKINDLSLPYVLLWFKADENTFELNRNLDGIILAENTLTLSGTGRFRGAIITQGELIIEDKIRTSYSKAIVENTAIQFSFWQHLPYGWSDFLYNDKR